MNESQQKVHDALLLTLDSGLSGSASGQSRAVSAAREHTAIPFTTELQLAFYDYALHAKPTVAARAMEVVAAFGGNEAQSDQGRERAIAIFRHVLENKSRCGDIRSKAVKGMTGIISKYPQFATADLLRLVDKTRGLPARTVSQFHATFQSAAIINLPSLKIKAVPSRSPGANVGGLNP